MEPDPRTRIWKHRLRLGLAIAILALPFLASLLLWMKGSISLSSAVGGACFLEHFFLILAAMVAPEDPDL